jgi:hypothetical protein
MSDLHGGQQRLTWAFDLLFLPLLGDDFAPEIAYSLE